MRILLVNGTAYPHIGGVENSLRFIGRELLRAGQQVRVFCFQMSPDEPLRMEDDGVEITRYPYTPTRWPHAQFLNWVRTAQQAIPAVIQEFKPDVIWCRSAYMGLGIRRGGYQGPLIQIFCTSARMNCRGLFLQTHGLSFKRRVMLLSLWPSAYLISSRLERELAPQCETVIFSENMRRQLLAAFPKEVCSCHTISPGVDCEVFSPENGARYFGEIGRQYGLRPDDPNVLYVGRLGSAKHISMLMDALALLRHPAKLVLVGSGRDEMHLKDYASRIGVTERTVFAGSHRELLPGFYAISRVFVLPTTTESFGQVFLEALASGTPAVGFGGDRSRVLTATDEIIRDGQTGGIVREVSKWALAEKIDSILSLDGESYAAMSQRAREDVKRRFSWKCFVKDVLALSARHVSGQPRPYDAAPNLL